MRRISWWCADECWSKIISWNPNLILIIQSWQQSTWPGVPILYAAATVEERGRVAMMMRDGEGIH